MSASTDRRRRRLRPGVVAAAAVLVASGACTSGEPEPDPVTVSGSAAVAAVDEVAVAQGVVDEALGDALSALRAGDETVRRLRTPASAAAALDSLEQRAEELEAIDVPTIDRALDDLRDATRTARDAVADASQDAAATEDAWLVDYLAAELAVLDAVADHADAGDQLLASVATHRDALVAVIGSAETVADRGDEVGAGEELVAALELELQEALDDLIAAQETTVEATERRADTATALNEASADAAAVAERRPAG